MDEGELIPDPMTGTNEMLLPCPNDTDGDGNCGGMLCPWCSDMGRENRLAVERREAAVKLVAQLMAQDDEWGEQNHPLVVPGLRESRDGRGNPNALPRAKLEYGYTGEEAVTTLMNIAIARGELSWAHVLSQDFGRALDALVTMGDLSIQEALISLAATAMNMVRTIDRKAYYDAQVIKLAERRMGVK